MQRFVRLISIFLLIQLGVLIGLVLLGMPPNTLYATILDKERRLRETPSPKLVMVGGSGLAFGVDSATIEEGLGGKYHAVNMGLHAGLGLDFMLDEALAGVRKGDVVLLAPEYDVVWRDEPNYLTIAETLRLAPSTWRYVPRRHWLQTLRAAVFQQPPVMLHDVAVNALRHSVPLLGSGGIYYRSSFNAYGDNRSGSDLPSSYVPVPEELVAHVNPTGYPRNLASIERFAAAARARGAQVFYLPAPIPKERYALDPSVYDRTAADIAEKAGVPAIGTPAEETYPNDLFLDSGDHLRGETVLIRSRRIAERLRAALQGEQVP